MRDVVLSVKKRSQRKLTDLGRPDGRRPPPATPGEVDADEARLGFRLPALLRRLYLEVGNGGFGPGHGLMGLSGGWPDASGRTAVDAYLYFRAPDPKDATWRWPEALLPICSWGGTVYSCIDCADPNFRIRRFDPGEHRNGPSWDDAFLDECESFDRWIAAWAQGTPANEAPASQRSTAKRATDAGRRLNRAFGPIVAGMIIDGGILP